MVVDIFLPYFIKIKHLQLSVIIVNYNVGYFLEQCLLSVEKAMQAVDGETIVVDNNSTDESKMLVGDKFPHVKFHWLKENLGFGKANNYALKTAQGKNVLFLNPDTIVGEDCFAKCLHFMESHHNAGALGVRMIDGGGTYLPESKRMVPTPKSSFYKMSGLGKLSKKLNTYHAPHLGEHETGKIDVLAGAFMLLNRKAVELTNGFDEDFFMYGEDIDLSFRILQAGLYNYYFPEVVILHFKGESSKGDSTAYLNQFYGAMQLFASKHFGLGRVSQSIIRSGIYLGKLKGKLALNKKKKQEIKPQQILLVCDAKNANFLKQTLLNNGWQVEQISVFEMHRVEDNKSLAAGFAANVQSSKTKQVVFSSGVLKNETIIKLMGGHPLLAQYFIHQQNSKSILCSGESTGWGSVIVL